MNIIKFNDEIINLDKINNIDIYDLNIFTNENFNFINDIEINDYNRYYYKTESKTDFNYNTFTTKTDNYKVLNLNTNYISRINGYINNNIKKIYNTGNISIVRDEETNNIKYISLHFKNNHLINIKNLIFDEEKNIDIKLINQYLYYMNIYFTNKYKKLENKYKSLEDFYKHSKDKIKNLETTIINNKSQEIDIKFLKYKIENQEEYNKTLENKIKKLNNDISYLCISIFMIIIMKIIII